MNNIKLRTAIERSRFKKYEIASAMGIAETSFSRLLRKELDEHQSQRIYDAIDQLTLSSKPVSWSRNTGGREVIQNEKNADAQRSGGSL